MGEDERPSKMEPDAALGRVPGMIVSSSLEGPPRRAPIVRPARPAVPDRPGPSDARDRPDPTGATGNGSVPTPVGATTPVLGFDDFYRRHRATIARALALSLGDADLAAEATDEAMTRAYERWQRVVTLERPEAWVYRVAWNWAMSIFRRRRRSLHPFYDPSVVDAATVSDPAVHAAVASLDLKHRSVVVCRHLLGWSVAETAEALGISEGTVKSRLFRATATLRTHLHDLHPEKDLS